MTRGVTWVEFTADDIRARMTASEVETYEGSSRSVWAEGATEPAVPEGTPERLPIIAGQVLARFRGAIRENPYITEMGPDGTLPDFCIAEAAVIGRVAALGLNPVPVGMTDPRRDEYRAASDFLKALPSMKPGAFGEAPSAETASATYGGSKLLDF